MLRYVAVFSRGQGADGGGGVCCWMRWSRSFRVISYWTMSKSRATRTVRGSDYSPAIELSEQKNKLVTATGDTEKYSEKQANKIWLNSVYWFSRY